MIKGMHKNKIKIKQTEKNWRKKPEERYNKNTKGHQMAKKMQSLW